MNKKLKIFGVGLALLALPATYAFRPADNYFEISKNLEIFSSVVKDVNSYYVEELEPAKLMRVGIDAMLKSLDPYTEFYSESEVEDYRFMVTGQYGGIGATITKKGDYVAVAEPYEGWPAQQNDLRGGDVIMEIDGKSAKGLNTEDVSKLLKGQPDTDVKLTLKREGQKDLIYKTLKRKEIKLKSVPFSGMVNAETGYIKFTGFKSQAASEVAEAFQNLKAKNPGMKGLIFDLRGNPGGLLDEAIKVVNIFVDKGLVVVRTKGKIEDWNKEYYTEGNPLDKAMPVVVLIDGSSASASEIVSGSLQDLDRAVVLGANSFGKGLVQTTRPLPYNSQMKITTSKYYIPSGRCIQAIDYGHKDEQGKAYKMPDSLKHAFKTRGGRIVYDGTGIKPDVVLPRTQYSDIVISLAQKQLIFDYATLYRTKHASIAPAAQFTLSDADWKDFLTFLADKEYDYTTDTDTELKKLEKIAKEEKYYDAIKDDLAQLEARLKADKKEDLIKHKAEIVELLEQEIAARYYYQGGRIMAGWKEDKDIQSALEILSNPARYKEILTAQK